MFVVDFGQAVFALDEIGNQIHRTRPIERDQRDDVVDLLDIELLRRAGHAAGFQLEHADRFAAVVEREGFRVVERNVLDGKIRLAFAGSISPCPRSR